MQGDGTSLAGSDLQLGAASPSPSTERLLMKHNLERVKETLNAISLAASGGGTAASPAAAHGSIARTLAKQTSSVSAAPSQQQPQHPHQQQQQQPHQASSALEKLLGDVSQRLSGIEQTYTTLSSKLTSVADRTALNERTVRELQHISAGAIHETARLVDIWGGAGPPPSSQPPPPPPTAQRSSAHVTPPPRPRVSSSRHTHLGLPASAAAAHATGALPLPPHTSGTFGSPGPLPSTPGLFGGGGLPTPSTVAGALALVPELASSQALTALHQHASQIHKLVVGLDFLEQHIIRQDQVIEGVQKQVVQVRDGRAAWRRKGEGLTGATTHGPLLFLRSRSCRTSSSRAAGTCRRATCS